MAAPTTLAQKLIFRGGHEYGPNATLGSWVLSVDDANALTLVRRRGGHERREGPSPLSGAESAELERLLDEASTAVEPSGRMGIPDEDMIELEFAARTVRHRLRLWHGEARQRPPLTSLLRWVDKVIKARTGEPTSFGA